MSATLKTLAKRLANGETVYYCGDCEDETTVSEFGRCDMCYHPDATAFEVEDVARWLLQVIAEGEVKDAEIERLTTPNEAQASPASLRGCTSSACSASAAHTQRSCVANIGSTPTR